MATLWEMQDDASWKCLTLEIQAHSPSPSGAIRLVPFDGQGKRETALLVEPPAPAYINGDPVLGNLHVLQHQDEIMAEGRRFYFSFESHPEVVSYHAQDGQKPVRCPVCRQSFQEGQCVVKCPGCGRVYHQIESSGEQHAKKCFTYYETCKFCGHTTSLSGEPSWQPETEGADV